MDSYVLATHILQLVDRICIMRTCMEGGDTMSEAVGQGEGYNSVTVM